jgi:Dienelactone hydrolase family
VRRVSLIPGWYDAARLAWLAAICAVLAGIGHACADQLAQIAPHRAAGTLEVPADTPPLFGYLARPDLPGRLPAVVVLHWCSGFGTHDVQAAAMLQSWGYVALAPDSLGHA